MSLLSKIWPFSAFREQANEIERLQGIITKQLMGDITLEDLHSNSNGLSMTLSGNPMHILAESFGKYFFESNSKNFIVMEFLHRDSDESFEITLQRVKGESVSSQLRRLRSELDAKVLAHEN